jgi:DNA repair protein RadC
MQILVPVGEDLRAFSSTRMRTESPAEPLQLSFLSPLPGAIAGTTESVHEDDPEYINAMRRLRRRRVRCVTKSDVENATGARDERAPLRTGTGEFLPPLYTRDESGADEALKAADAATIINSADSLLAYRFRRGVKILADPYLLLRFLRIRLVSQRQPVFAAFLLDRKQRLIHFSEIARGTDDRVVVYPREVVRDVLAHGAEQVLCVRSDPIGDHAATAYDVEDARRVKRALDLLEIPLLDYVIVGEGVTSLRQRGVLLG